MVLLLLLFVELRYHFFEAHVPTIITNDFAFGLSLKLGVETDELVWYFLLFECAFELLKDFTGRHLHEGQILISIFSTDGF